MNKSQLLNAFTLQPKMLSAGEKIITFAEILWVFFCLKSKTSQSAARSLLLALAGVCFLPDAAAASRLPGAQPSRSRESSAPNVSVSIIRGGRKKRKMVFHPKIHFTSDLQTLIYSKPTKGLSSHRKPKPFLPETTNAPSRQHTLAWLPVQFTAPWLCLKSLRLLWNTLSNKTPARGH